MTGVTQADVLRLAEPTPKERTKQRQGNRQHNGECNKQYGVCQLKHKMLDYVTARFVMDRLDELGPGNWQDRYEDRPNGSVRCGIGVNVEGEWVWKWDVGDESDIEAEKGAHSGAFKRAGVKWGIGRDLYGEDAHEESARPPTTARSAPAAPPRPASVPDDPYGDLPNDWDAGLPPVAAAPAQPTDPRDGFYGDTCPKHKGRPWKDTKYGPKCTAQDEDGKNGYCIWKPSRRWIAEHETAGVA